MYLFVQLVQLGERTKYEKVSRSYLFESLVLYLNFIFVSVLVVRAERQDHNLKREFLEIIA